MENQTGQSQEEKKDAGFKVFAVKRIIMAAILIIAVVWLLGMGLNLFGPSQKALTQKRLETARSSEMAVAGHTPQAAATVQSGPAVTTGPLESKAPPEAAKAAGPGAETGGNAGHPITIERPQPSSPESKTPKAAGETAAPQAKGGTQQGEKPAAAVSQAEVEPAQKVLPRGVTFVEAVIKPIDYELNKRFWGWRPNDILNVTDNINNFQLGVLEVTRRSVVMLTERISRTGSTDTLNPNLEDAANWLMVTATRYWFPSPESKYKECIKELEDYKQELIRGSASFYIRTDNLIPLLASYEDLLGSCDENLVKAKNEDGTRVSLFKADDYFYYAKGVASAMATILEAVQHDFLPTLESRHGTELLHHAVLSCRRAAALSPLLITDADLDGILANHRANMAAPVSHARFYIGQLIKTLST
jgi:hypothetical protein